MLQKLKGYVDYKIKTAHYNTLFVVTLSKSLE